MHPSSPEYKNIAPQDSANENLFDNAANDSMRPDKQFFSIKKFFSIEQRPTQEQELSNIFDFRKALEMQVKINTREKQAEYEKVLENFIKKQHELGISDKEYKEYRDAKYKAALH